jgi:PAS domain S-box-containing protein
MKSVFVPDCAALPTSNSPTTIAWLSAIAQTATAALSTSPLEQELVACRQTVELLRQREAHYRRLLEEQSDPICCFRPDFTITFVNQAYCALFGKPSTEILGQSMLALVPQEHHASVIAHLATLTPTNPVVTAENPIRSADGALRWFQWTDRLIVDEAGQIIEYQGVGRDITVRHQNETAEREQRRVAEALRDSVAALTDTLSIDEVMQQILASANTVVPSQVISIILFEGDEGRTAYLRGFSPKANKFFQDYRFTRNAHRSDCIFLPDQPYLIADTQNSPDWLPLEINDWVRSSIGVPITSGGQAIGLLTLDCSTPNHFQPADLEKLQIFAQYASLALEKAFHVQQLAEQVDMRTAELQAAKEQVEAILNHSPDAILSLQPDLAITQANVVFTKLFGSSVNCSLLDLVHVDDQATVAALAQNVIARQTGDSLEIRAYHRDGTLLDVELSIGPVKEAGLVCILRDVTDRKRAQTALLEERTLLRTVVDTIPDVIYVKDLEHRFVLCNHTPAYSIRPQDPDNYLGKTDFDFHPPAAAERFRAEEQAIFTTGQPIIRQEMALERDDGGVTWLLTTKVPLRNHEGKIIGLTGISHDITKRKEHERQLLFFASLQEDVSDAVIAVDLELHIQSWNRAAETIYGRRADEVIGLPITAVLNQGYGLVDLSSQERREFFQHGSWQGEAMTQLADGRARWLFHSLTLLRDEQGRPIGMVAVSRDITERKESEERLRTSEERYRLLADHNSDMILRISIAGNYLYLSPSTYTMMGYEPAELLGQPYVAFVHPDDQKLLLRTYTPKGQPRLDLPPMRIRFRHKQGHYVWLENTGRTIVSPTGEPLEFIITSRNVTQQVQAETALRASEEKFRRLIETMSSGVFLCDLDLVITYVNERFCTLLGYQAGELLNTRFVDYVDEASLAQVDRQIAKRRQGESSAYELVIKQKEGERRHWLLSGSPWYDEQQQLVGSFAVVTDITLQKKAESALEESLRKEKELNELKSRFVSMTSHEFRTPLTSILMMTETLQTYRRKLTEEQIEQRITGIREQCLHLKGIMEDVLELARMQAGRTEFKPAPLALADLCQQIIAELQPSRALAPRLHYECTDTMPIANLDKRLMHQIIANLIVNALKYSPSDQPVLVCLAYREGSFVLEVRDHGIGIPAADLPHLFQPFHRASNVGVIQGTGLGLVITKEAVALHEGTINVTSQVGVGTTFTVTIPMLPTVSTELVVEF